MSNLHLRVNTGDKIFIGEGNEAVVVSIEQRGPGGIKLLINAPDEVPINTIFKDTSKQFKNRSKKKTGVDNVVEENDSGNK